MPAGSLASLGVAPPHPSLGTESPTPRAPLGWGLAGQVDPGRGCPPRCWGSGARVCWGRQDGGDPGGTGHPGPAERAAASLPAPQAHSPGGLCACGAGKGGQGPPDPSNKSTLIKSPRVPTVSPPEWWSGRGGDKTPVCNGAFIKGRDGALQDTGGGGGFITGAEPGPSLGKPRYLSKHELFKSIKNFTQPVFIRF